MPFNHFLVVVFAACVAANRSASGRFDNSAARVLGRVVIDYGIFVDYIGVGLKRWQHKRVGVYIAGNKVGAELRVERTQLGHRYIHDL